MQGNWNNYFDGSKAPFALQAISKLFAEPFANIFFLLVFELMQCDAIARGMASVLQIPIVNGVLIRSVTTQSQTKKNRFQRFENMESVFSLAQANAIKGKNILLLDDVLTTGATLVSAAQVLQQAGVQHIYIGAIAKA